MVEHGVTHRDISRGNVLCKPQHVGKIDEVPVQFDDLPYIEKVLCVRYYLDDLPSGLILRIAQRTVPTMQECMGRQFAMHY